MTLDSTLQADLRRLFSMLERNVPKDDLEQTIPSVTVGIAPGETFTFRGEALRLLRDLIRRLARPASEGGPSPDEADNIVTGACRRFLDAGEQEALDWLDSKLKESPRRWTVVRPTNTFQHRADEVVIGSCHIRRGIPELPFEVEGYGKEAFPAFTISVDVEARDQRAAELIAERQFAEALSVIQLSDRSSTHALGLATLVVRPDDMLSFREGRPRERTSTTW
jgi:hypothetical protein